MNFKRNFTCEKISHEITCESFAFESISHEFKKNFTCQYISHVQTREISYVKRFFMKLLDCEC